MIELPVLSAAETPASETPARIRFWRSFSQLRNDPAFVAMARNEFLPGGDPGGHSRRQFLQLMGASMALAGLTACRKPVEKILPYTRKEGQTEQIIEGIPVQYATAMPFRGSLRPLLVESHEGRPTKVEGNPDHAFSSEGASGLFEQASVLNLYDPDRSTRVMQGGNPSSWADFVRFCQQFQGTRVAVLAEPTSSMTMAAVRASMTARFPGLRWVSYAAEGDDRVALGMQMAYGRPLRPRYQLSQARVIASLDGDFLSPTDRDFVWNTHQFAQGRKIADPQQQISRLYVVESGYSITGAAADHRLRLRSSEVPAFAAALATALGVPTPGGEAFARHPMLTALAADLQQAGAAAVVLAGENQPPAVHALCAAVNSRIGSGVVSLCDTGEPVGAQSPALAELVGAMNEGQLDALLLLGVNPVYDAPAGLDFAEALKRVTTTIHLGTHVDETAAACTWHLPQAHYLEAWGDGRSYEGTMSVIQPLIAPLYADAHSEIEVANVLATGTDVTGYELVRSCWRSVLPGSFDQAWQKVLHDGFLAGSAYPVVSATAAAPASYPVPQIGADELELVFHLDPKVLDGRFANNAWLQELPDATTKITWDNVAMVSPATAERLGLAIDLNVGKSHVNKLTLTLGERQVELPAWIQPGMADNSVHVTLGYGRTLTSPRQRRDWHFFDLDHYTDVYGGGPLANGVGVNVAALRATEALPILIGVAAAKTGGDYLIASTQDHGAMEAEIAEVMFEVRRRGLYRQATLGEFRENPAFVQEGDPEPIREPWEDYPALWEENHPAQTNEMKNSPYFKNQWGMVIDLNACTGCNACVIACQSENNIQVVGKDEVLRGREMHWIRIDRYFISPTDDLDTAQMVLQPVPCMHCENAPCESVCPVAATYHSPDGTNQMTYNRCIGTRYCANNCPYKVRRFNYFNWSKTLPTTVQMTQNPNVTVRSRGVIEKCSYCIQRIREANKQSNLENRALHTDEVQTACQQACPARAITFGDLNDPNSQVVREKQNSRRYEMLAELSVKPRTSYLGRVRNPNPQLETAAG
jgi:molybdopterin-containing oxidoreductase family iron-sulfur binding subunit